MVSSLTKKDSISHSFFIVLPKIGIVDTFFNPLEQMKLYIKHGHFCSGLLLEASFVLDEVDKNVSVKYSCFARSANVLHNDFMLDDEDKAVNIFGELDYVAQPGQPT